jgi:hypothetical protein
LPIETKDGKKTTEFWLIVIGSNVAPILMAASGVLPPEYAVIAMAAANALYAVARGLAKHGVKPDAPDAVVHIENK